MSRITSAFLLLAITLLILQYASAAAVKRCDAKTSDKYEEDRLDAVMHPDMRSKSNNRRLLNGEDTNNYWLQLAKEKVRDRVLSTSNRKKAKNVILFLGDGMGVTTLAAARNLIGGEEQKLSFEDFPAVGLSKTYALDKIVPDSACTATAYLCGVKGNYGTIGVNGNVQRSDCDAMAKRENHVSSIAEWALAAGKAAGLVTTTRVTHASPAGIYAHTANRNWENDKQLKKACGKNTKLEDIALQLIHGDVGSKLKVILGGGRREFMDSSFDGDRSDGRNLIKEYLAESTSNAYVETLAELEQVNLNKTSRLLGLFKKSHLDFHLEAIDNKKSTQPTLSEMTQKAIEFLQNNKTGDEGYFLFVEGGLIDLGHHGTNARLALDEMVEFSDAIELAKAMTNEEETLIVVTADHSHTFTIAGYQDRGSDIFGPALAIADDDNPYLALNYANGPSFETFYNTDKKSRKNPVKQGGKIDPPYDVFPVTVPLKSETHSGEDVAVYASGPWAELFTGVYEQSAIPHLMAYAACWGNGLKSCT